MTVVKVIELLAESKDGWEAATKEAIKEASKSIKDIKSVYVKDMQAIVEGNEIVNYRVNVKISFRVNFDEKQKK
ncbi:MAG TPA: dodecin family protein [Bacteroidales bacterium]|nr:dodecin family protein [Bacteroidales bacterium]